MDSKLLGRWGEEQAAGYLRKKRYTIIGMNYRIRHGEIDIIAKDGSFVVFAEVKLRKNSRFAEAREFVTKSKQEKLRTAASIWLSQNDTALQPRFDVIEIYAPNGADLNGMAINHIENAF